MMFGLLFKHSEHIRVMQLFMKAKLFVVIDCNYISSRLKYGIQPI